MDDKGGRVIRRVKNLGESFEDKTSYSERAGGTNIGKDFKEEDGETDESCDGRDIDNGTQWLVPWHLLSTVKVDTWWTFPLQIPQL